MGKLQSSQTTGIVILSLCLTVIAVITAVISGPGSRFGWWSFRTGFVILKWGGYISVAAAVTSLIGAIITRPHGLNIGFILSLAGIAISITLVVILVQWKTKAKNVPPIHDITTDSNNPPLFSAIIALRKDAPNQFEYGGSEIASQQQLAYPDISPLLLGIRPEQAFTLALEIARDKLCWDIVYINQDEGKIEATDTTFWFGFKDDIVIRITPAENGSRTDLRSVSRVGKSDAGTNAKRIRKFLKLLKKSQGIGIEN